MNQITPPAIKKPRGSFFPLMPRAGSYGYTVEHVDGEILYMGNSEPVARLIAACMTPRTS